MACDGDSREGRGKRLNLWPGALQVQPRFANEDFVGWKPTPANLIIKPRALR